MGENRDVDGLLANNSREMVTKTRRVHHLKGHHDKCEPWHLAICSLSWAKELTYVIPEFSNLP